MYFAKKKKKFSETVIIKMLELFYSHHICYVWWAGFSRQSAFIRVPHVSFFSLTCFIMLCIYIYIKETLLINILKPTLNDK